jgi:multidrug efflux system membrane fusion protein
VANVHTVKPGVTEGEVTQVDGINPGDVVANSSFEKLQDKSPVTTSAGAPKS